MFDLRTFFIPGMFLNIFFIYAIQKLILRWKNFVCSEHRDRRQEEVNEVKIKKKNEKTKHACYLKKRLKISLTQNFLFVPKNFVSLSFSLINKSASETGNVSVGKDSLEKE